MILLASVEPMQVYAAFGNLYVGFLAVLAILKVKFAAAITLGAALGQTLQSAIEPHVRPPLKKIIPEQYEKWVPVILNSSCKSVGITVAWTIERVISSFHSAVRGTQILAIGVEGWMAANSMLQGNFDGYTAYFQMFGMALAVSGVFYQISRGFLLPFPLNIILFPFMVLEWVLVYFATH